MPQENAQLRLALHNLVEEYVLSPMLFYKMMIWVLLSPTSNQSLKPSLPSLPRWEEMPSIEDIINKNAQAELSSSPLVGGINDKPVDKAGYYVNISNG